MSLSGRTKESGPGHSGGARASLGAWPRPPSLARCWLCSLEKRRRRLEEPQPSPPRETRTALGRGGPTLGRRSGLSLRPRLSEPLLFSYPFSIYSIDQRTNLFYRGHAPAVESPVDGGPRGRDMLVAPAGRRGWPGRGPHPTNTAARPGRAEDARQPRGARPATSPHRARASPGTQTAACAPLLCT